MERQNDGQAENSIPPLNYFFGGGINMYTFHIMYILDLLSQ